jgi:hypothetical protein
MKLTIYINWDYIGLMVAMMLYPCWCAIEIVWNFIRAVKICSEEKISSNQLKQK